MYRYVSKKEAKPRKAYCRKVMESLQVELKKHCGIEIQYQMIGSGAKNLVTRNGNGPYDLDYNISFTELPDNYRDDPGKLKAAVRQQLDRLIKEPFSRGKDSTSSITYLLQNAEGNGIAFNLDVALIWRKADGAYRLIYDKKENHYIWNQQRNLTEVSKKAAAIKKAGGSTELRAAYLKLKNLYLKKGEEDHPSFVVYGEAVNQVFRQLKLNLEGTL